MTSSNSIFLSLSCQIQCNVYFGYRHVVTLSDIGLSIIFLLFYFHFHFSLFFSCGLRSRTLINMHCTHSILANCILVIMYYIEAPSSCKICRIFILQHSSSVSGWSSPRNPKTPLFMIDYVWGYIPSTLVGNKVLFYVLNSSYYITMY